MLCTFHFYTEFQFVFFRCSRISELSRLSVHIELLIEYWGLWNKEVLQCMEIFGINVTKIMARLTQRLISVSA